MSLFSDEDISVRKVYVSGPMATKLLNVSFVPTPVFDASLTNVFKISLIGNVSSSSFISARPGQKITFIIAQDEVGGRTFAWPSNVVNGMTVGDAANQISIQEFIFADDNNLYPVGPPFVSDNPLFPA